MRKIKYVVKGEQSVTECPCGRTTFAGEPKMVGTLGCIMCVYHAGQSYTESGGVVNCLDPEGEKRKVNKVDKVDKVSRVNRVNKVKKQSCNKKKKEDKV